jgi:hypothetical protein
LQVTGLESALGQTTEFTVHLKPASPCSSPSNFLFNGELFYAIFGSTTKSNSCCGTAEALLPGSS